MRRLVTLAGLVVLGGGLYLASPWLAEQTRAAGPDPAFRTARIDRGDIVAAVSATGTINPITTVIVGSQMSGIVREILADFNSEVKANQIVARLDDTQVRARLEAARADMMQAQAQVSVQQAQAQKNIADTNRARAQLADAEAQLARNELLVADTAKTLERQVELNERGVASAVALQAARTAHETSRAQRNSAEAQISSARAAIAALEADRLVIEAQIRSAEAVAQQRAAIARQIEVDLSNMTIRSPVDGVVVNRQIELGQTVAASLQAPTLFLIAQDLREMEIYANVDETDVGRVKPGQTVSFTVNAYPSRTFEGQLKLVRLGSQTVQNVVIYTAIISVRNPQLELRPGMTANLRILTERRENVLRVSNAALRWRPPGAAPEAPAPAAANPLSPDAAPRRQASPQGGQNGRAMAEFAEAIRSEIRPDSEQQKKIDAIVAASRTRFQQAMAEAGDAAQRRERLRGARDEMAKEIDAVLTPEQKPLFDALRQRLAAGRQGGGAAQGIAARVFIPGADGKPQAVAIRAGASDGATTEILSGALKEGQEVITGGGAKPQGSTSPFGRFF